MAQEEYDAFLKARNFKLALESLRQAAKSLGKAGEAGLERKVAQLGKEVIATAFGNLPREQWKVIENG